MSCLCIPEGGTMLCEVQTMSASILAFLTSSGYFNGIFCPKENVTLVNESQCDVSLKPMMTIPAGRPSGLQDI